jgi:DNA-binding phage protein
MRASVPFDETSRELLKDPETAAMYLEECLADGDFELFKLALRHVAEARLGSKGDLPETHTSNRD